MSINENPLQEGKSCKGRGLVLGAFLTDRDGERVLYRPAEGNAPKNSAVSDTSCLSPCRDTFRLTVQREKMVVCSITLLF